MTTRSTVTCAALTALCSTGAFAADASLDKAPATGWAGTNRGAAAPSTAIYKVSSYKAKIISGTGKLTVN